MKKYHLFIALLTAVAGCSCFIAGTSNSSPCETDHLTICSFNIQFLGHFKKKEDKSLTTILKDYDIVAVQELVAPPTAGTYPDGEAFTADTESAEFFEAMCACQGPIVPRALVKGQ